MNAPIRSETQPLLALDDYPLAATRYFAERPRAQLLIAGATGVPQGFYCLLYTSAAKAAPTEIVAGRDRVARMKSGDYHEDPGLHPGYGIDCWSWERLGGTPLQPRLSPGRKSLRG